MYEIRTTNKYEKSFEGLDKPIQEQILKKIEDLKTSPVSIPPMRYMPLSLKGLRKCRTGDWRIFYFVKDTIVTLYDVDKRDTAYRDLS